MIYIQNHLNVLIVPDAKKKDLIWLLIWLFKAAYKAVYIFYDGVHRYDSSTHFKVSK